MRLFRDAILACLSFSMLVVATVVLACPIEPEMVRIPKGHFQMGSPDSEEGHRKDERLHWVNVDHFAIGKYAVTFAEYDCFTEDTEAQARDDEGWGRGKRPVINVSWLEAAAYAQWLSGKTGKHYRLPTEAEWEYAARAGTTTVYYWGNQIGHNDANCDGCGSPWGGKQTTPVGSFASNPWGLYDMLGNVWQWTCSAYSEDYNGSEKICVSDQDTNRRSFRGGAWALTPVGLRVAFRAWNSPVFRFSLIGFRLVQDESFAG